MTELLRTLVAQDAFLFLAAGGAGGLVRHLLSRGGLILPSVKKVKGERLLRLGFLTSMVVGGAMGLLIDHHYLTAFGWGIAGPYSLEKLAQRVANGHLKAGK